MSASLIALFHDEASRLIRHARSLAASGDGDVAARRTELFRALHSLKGMCASVGLDDAARLAHEAEELARTAPLPARGRFARCLASLAARVGRPDAEGAADGEPPVESEGLVTLPPIRVEAERLDRLIDTATSLAATLERLEHRLGPPDDSESLALRHALRRETRSLGRALLEMRLLRLSELAGRFERAVERWAEQRGVTVRFRLEGGGVRVDRGLVWRLLDPLAQLLRNAVAHGPGSRSGRPLEVRLHAAREAGRLRFEIRDDGRGLDPAAVRRRAIRRGVITPDQAARLDDAGSLELLTRDGMSRLAGADELAGRGVGLASTRAAIRSLGGRLELRSRPGEGFSATILVPARLAITDGLMVELGGRTFAVLAAPIEAVRDTADRALGVPRVGLAERLGITPGDAPGRHALIVGSGRGKIALIVGRVIERRELVIRPLGAPLERLGPWAGAALLAEGGLALVLDPARLLDWSTM